MTPEPRKERDGSSGAPDEGRADWTRALREAAPLLGLGSTLAASVLLGLGAGYWLDGKLGTKPWLFLVGGAFGMLTAFVQFYQMVVSRKR